MLVVEEIGMGDKNCEWRILEILKFLDWLIKVKVCKLGLWSLEFFLECESEMIILVIRCNKSSSE